MIEFKTVPQLQDIRHLIESKGLDIKAFCFDMDGTLFNTEHIHLDVSWRAMSEVIPDKVKDQGDFNELIHGMSDDQVSHSFDLNEDSDESKQFFLKRKQYWDLAFEDKPQIYLPEIHELLSEIKKAPYPMALVTSSSRQQCMELMKSTGFIQFFDFIVTRDDVISPKPSPEPYHQAINKLGFEAKNYLIFEDSEVGLASAKASGATPIKVSWY